MSVARVNARCFPISLSWSHVSERRSVAGGGGVHDADEGGADGEGAAVFGEVDEHGVAAGAVDERRDRGITESPLRRPIPVGDGESGA